MQKHLPKSSQSSEESSFLVQWFFLCAFATSKAPNQINDTLHWRRKFGYLHAIHPKGSQEKRWLHCCWELRRNKKKNLAVYSETWDVKDSWIILFHYIESSLHCFDFGRLGITLLKRIQDTEMQIQFSILRANNQMQFDLHCPLQISQIFGTLGQEKVEQPLW